VSSLSAVLSESFEDVFAAVQETERGRWFLDEYAARLRSEETKSVLSAIQKLENVVTNLPAQPSKSAELDKVKVAIKLAREQISTQLAPLSNQGTQLSQEGQMFAALAKLSREALTTEATDTMRQNVGKGIDVALQLVQDIDNELGFAPPPKLEESAPPPVRKGEVSITIKSKPTPEQQKFFQQDADVFAPPQSAEFKSPGSAKAGDESAGKGARLTINKHDPAKQPTTEHAPVAANVEASSHTPVADMPAEGGDKPRIVIIRRKPEELTQMPLADEQKPDDAA
jgi:hypothetical protein